eukprot:6661958-Alexandrium_andersonii.AAC.1
MSASLVGSEMCIRDRAKRTRARTRTRPARTRAPAASPARAPAASAQWRSVSYTHLTLPTICSV